MNTQLEKETEGLNDTSIIDKFATQRAVNEAVVLALGRVPEFGWLLSGCVSILLPEGKGASVWSSIVGDVETLLNVKINHNDLVILQEHLEGLNISLHTFLKANENSIKASTWLSVRTAFETLQPLFKPGSSSKVSFNDRVIRLPLFAQFANLYLGFLKNGIINGKEWGWNDQTINGISDDLNKNIISYCSYVDTYVKLGHEAVTVNVKFNQTTALWNAKNKFIREMTFMVTDFRTYWPYINKETPTATPSLTREIYTDIIGSITDNPDLQIPKVINRLTGLKVWGASLIDAVQTRYGNNDWNKKIPIINGNPGGGGTSQPPKGWSGIIPNNNSLVSYSSTSRTNVPESITLNFQNLTSFSCGSKTAKNVINGSYKGEIISQVITSGASTFTLTAESLIFGFRYEDSYESDNDLFVITKNPSGNGFGSMEVYYQNYEYSTLSESIDIPDLNFASLDPSDCVWLRGTYKNDPSAIFGFVDECLQLVIYSSSTQTVYKNVGLDRIWDTNKYDWNFTIGYYETNQSALFAFLQAWDTEGQEAKFLPGDISLQILDSDYQKVIKTFTIPIPNINGLNFKFMIGKYDNDPSAIFCIKIKDTGSTFVELHILPSNHKGWKPYEDWIKHFVLYIPQSEQDNYKFRLGGSQNDSSILYCIKVKNTTSGFVEITGLIGNDYTHKFLQKTTSIPIDDVDKYADFFIGRGCSIVPPLD
jgi:hypothetical protein